MSPLAPPPQPGADWREQVLESVRPELDARFDVHLAANVDDPDYDADAQPLGEKIISNREGRIRDLNAPREISGGAQAKSRVGYRVTLIHEPSDPAIPARSVIVVLNGGKRPDTTGQELPVIGESVQGPLTFVNCEGEL